MRGTGTANTKDIQTAVRISAEEVKLEIAGRGTAIIVLSVTIIADLV